MPCAAPSRTLLEPFRCLFTAPTWKHMLTLLRGTLLARGRRTVTAALWHTGHQQDPHFSPFHQVLNRAHWSPLAASRHLLHLIVATFVQAGGTLDVVIDETLERRWGAKMRKRGHSRASALSSRERSVSSPGLRWIVLAVVVRVPWTKQRWALPFLAVLATTPDVSQQLGLRHKTLGLPAPQLVSLLRRWLPGVPIKLLGDLAYSTLERGLHCTTQQITLMADGPLAPGLGAPPTASGAPPPHGGAAARGWSTPALDSARPAGSADGVADVAAADAGLVGARQTGRGTVYGNGLLVPLWLDSLVHALGAHP
jgi:hypothetical protein